MNLVFFFLLCKKFGLRERKSHPMRRSSIDENTAINSNQASVLRHGDLITLSVDGKGYLASSDNNNDNGGGSDLCLLPMEEDGSFPADFQSRCVCRIEFTQHGYECAGEPVIYGANGNGIRLIHVQTQRYISSTNLPMVSLNYNSYWRCSNAEELMFAARLIATT